MNNKKFYTLGIVFLVLFMFLFFILVLVFYLLNKIKENVKEIFLVDNIKCLPRVKGIAFLKDSKI